MSEDARRQRLARFTVRAARGEVPGVPPLPDRAADLFGEAGWLRRLARAASADPELAGLTEQVADAERAWRQRVRELLGRLTRIEAVAGDLDGSDPATEDRKRELRAEIDTIAGQVRDLGQRDARGILAGLGLLPQQAGAGDAAPPEGAGRTARLVNLLGYWARQSAIMLRGAGTQGEIRLRQPDGSVTHWQVSKPATTGPDLVLRRLDAAPMEVAVFLDAYDQRAAPARNRIAADAATRARLRAAGTIVFQMTADEVSALVEGGAAPRGAPYEADAQAAASRGYRALGGDPARLEDMIWRGSARMLLAFLANPDRDHWAKAATAALAGLLIRPGAWRTGLTMDDYAQRIRAAVLADPLPGSSGRERTLVRVLDATGCPVTVLSDQRRAGPDAPLGSWTGLAVLDDRLVAIRASEPAHRRRWAGWLYWGNLLQFTDGRQLAHTTLDEFDPRTLAAFDDGALPQPAEPLEAGQLETAWDGRVEVIGREVAVLADTLAFLGVPAPADGQVGYELGDEAWQAELAWPLARVAVLAGGPRSGIPAAELADCAAAYRAAGWDARRARDWPPDELAVRILEADRFLAAKAAKRGTGGDS